MMSGMAGDETSRRWRKDFAVLRARLEERLEADPTARERYETARQAMRDALTPSAPRDQAAD
jgi:predicted transcriptional regulator